jgi:hypothetical protein
MFQVGLEFKVPNGPQRQSGSTPFPVTAIEVALLAISLSRYLDTVTCSSTH